MTRYFFTLPCLNSTELGTGARPGKSLAWSDLLTVCLSFVVLDTTLCPSVNLRKRRTNRSLMDTFNVCSVSSVNKIIPWGGGWGNEDGAWTNGGT